MPRPSPVTDEVRRLLQAGERHAWSLNELHQGARQTLGSADYSSVFRAVAALERDGVIRRIDLGDGQARYELSDDHHEHIRCERCGRVEEVAACVLEDVGARIQELTGFEVTGHQVVFGGLCADCRD
jgi:Fur family ferric uptake transcriptional regulator